jgi:hypothetical protein
MTILKLYVLLAALALVGAKEYEELNSKIAWVRCTRGLLARRQARTRRVRGHVLGPVHQNKHRACTTSVDEVVCLQLADANLGLNAETPAQTSLDEFLKMDPAQKTKPVAYVITQPWYAYSRRYVTRRPLLQSPALPTCSDMPKEWWCTLLWLTAPAARIAASEILDLLQIYNGSADHERRAYVCNCGAGAALAST